MINKVRQKKHETGSSIGNYLEEKQNINGNISSGKNTFEMLRIADNV